MSTYKFFPGHVELLKANSRTIRKGFAMFHKEISQKSQNGGELINLGGVLQPWAYLDPLGILWRKQQLAWAIIFHLKLVRRRRKEKIKVEALP